MKFYIKSDTYWAHDVNSIQEIKSEIRKSCNAGTTLSDVEDYLKALRKQGKINSFEEYDALLEYAERRIKYEKQNRRITSDTETSADLSDDEYINSVVSKHQPNDTEYISFSYDCSADSVELYAEATDALYELDDDYYELKDLDGEAISALEEWATNIATEFRSANKCLALADSLESQTQWDWYSGMSFLGGDSPFTYAYFLLSAENDDSDE